MLITVWYKLLPMGTRSSARDPQEDVQCEDTSTVSNLRRLVKAANIEILQHATAMQLEVHENGNDDTPCVSTKLLTNCVSGGPQLPFVIYYPPGINFLVSATIRI
jgi:hypothetical protein